LRVISDRDHACVIGDQVGDQGISRAPPRRDLVLFSLFRVPTGSTQGIRDA
jgi:hypothetical protein